MSAIGATLNYRPLIYKETKLRYVDGGGISHIPHGFPKFSSIYQPNMSPHSITKKVMHITQGVLEGSDDFIRTASEVTMTAGNIFRESLIVADLCEKLKPIFGWLKAGSILSAPIHLFNLGNGIYEYSTHRITLGRFLINTFGSIGRFTASIVLLLRDLAAIAVIPLEVLKYLWPFDLIGIALNAISITSHTMGWAETAQFAKEFEDLIAPYKQDDFSSAEVMAVMELVNKTELSKLGMALDSDGEKVARRVDKIGRDVLRYGFLTGDPKSVEARKEWKKAMKALKGRMTSKVVSHKLTITTSSIDAVANSILFGSLFFAPAGAMMISVGLALKGVSGVISLSNMIFKIVTSHQFSKGLGLDKDETESVGKFDKNIIQHLDK